MKLKLRTETDWERWRADTIYTKEPETIAWIQDFEPNTTFWDIGANIGIYSLFCAIVNPTCFVHAFEPLRSNYIRLWDNIWTNSLTNVYAHYICIGNHDGNCWFEAKNDAVGSSGGQSYCKESIVNKNKFDAGYFMPISTGDHLSNTYNWPDYVKIDVDGNEYDILMGMKGMLSNGFVKSILVEINRSKRDILSLLAANGMTPDDKYNKLKDRDSDNNIIFRRSSHVTK